MSRTGFTFARGVPRPPSDQARTTWSPSTFTLMVASALVAGPFLTEPSVVENWLPWLGQVETPSTGASTVVPMWVQAALFALTSLPLRTMRIMPPPGLLTTTPPPSGTLASAVRPDDEPPPVGVLLP